MTATTSSFSAPCFDSVVGIIPFLQVGFPRGSCLVQEIGKMLEKSVLQVVMNESTGFHSYLFLVKKGADAGGLA